MTPEARSLLDEILLTALVAGSLLVLLLPSARGSTAVGWLPMWLVAMPAVALWASRGFPLPRRGDVRAARAGGPRARRVQPQARRATRAVHRASGRRAA